MIHGICRYEVYDRVMLLYDKNYILNLAKPGDTGTIKAAYPAKNGKHHYEVYFHKYYHDVYIREEDLVRV